MARQYCIWMSPAAQVKLALAHGTMPAPLPLLLLSAGIGVAATSLQVAAAEPRRGGAVGETVDQLTIDATATPEQTGLAKFWQASVGSGHARLGLRADWQQQLKAVHDDTGIHGVRFHGSFDDDMGPVVTLGKDGEGLVYNFTLIDRLYDGILAAGVVSRSNAPTSAAFCLVSLGSNPVAFDCTVTTTC
jgi:xylan 1,4-beta-xylosidase